jgi:RHS repeat-associated protein
MNRLDYSELGGTQNLDLAYEDNGNILNKDDVSGSNYGYHASKVHAVTSAGTNSFEYDANGNAKKRNGHTITWTSYNKPSDINGSGGQDSRFWYAPDRSRWKQVATYTGGTETTIYVGGLLEKRTVGSVTEYQHVIPAPDGTRIHRVLRSNSTTDTFYLATDHLGSTDAILNGSGGVEVYTSFDAFGQRRDPTDWDGPPSSSDLSKIADTTRRGYTGHEHLDNLGLIHMNGRVQDPLVGRFISADPYVTRPYFSQNLNRLSYVYNSPLSWTDPNGFDGDRRRNYCFIFDCSDWPDDYDHNNRYADELDREEWARDCAAGLPVAGCPAPGDDANDDQPDAPGPEIGPPIEDSRSGRAAPVATTDDTLSTYTAGPTGAYVFASEPFEIPGHYEVDRYARQLRDHLTLRVRLLRDNFEQMTPGDRRSNFGHGAAIVELQIGMMERSLTAQFFADLGENMLSTASSIHPSTGWWRFYRLWRWFNTIGREYDVNAWDAQCRNLSCGFVDPNDRMHQICHVAPPAVRGFGGC